jgi:hypothetical protein
LFGPYAAWSEGVTAATLPAPPPHTPVSDPTLRDPELPYIALVAGDGMLRACWRAPDFDGHSEITGYEVLLDPPPAFGPNPIPVEAPEQCVLIEGVTNGTPYVVSVRSVNEAGASDWSGPSDPATPHALALADLAITPASVEASGRATGRIWLDGFGPPPVGVDVLISSYDPATAWPEGGTPDLLVHVPYGATTATFPIRTSSEVALATDVTFSATLGAGLPEPAVLQVMPRPASSCASA